MDHLDLTDFFLTKAQSQDFASKLSSILERIFEINFNFERTAAELLGMGKADKLIELMRNNSISTQSNIQIKEFLNKILKQISITPVLSLTLAIEPNGSVMKSLSEWCNFNVGQQVIFDITVDSKILGGAEIFYNGKHSSFSVKPIFEKISTEITTKHIQNPSNVENIPSTTPNSQTTHERIVN